MGYDNNIRVCVSTETSRLLSVEAPLYLPLVLHAFEKDTRIRNPEPSLLEVKPFGEVCDTHIVVFRFTYSLFRFATLT